MLQNGLLYKIIAARTDNHALLRSSNDKYELDFWIPQKKLNSIETHLKNHRFQLYYPLWNPALVLATREELRYLSNFIQERVEEEVKGMKVAS